jgi:alkylation response protein AidB-like acyl-CoA dehydrogenase
MVALAESAGNGAHRDLLDTVVAGKEMLTWAVHEPDLPWDPARPRTTAARTAGGYVLAGVKDRVEAGDQAGTVVVAAALDGELALFVVAADVPGVRVERVWSLDLTRHFATVHLDGVQLVEAQRIAAADPAELVERMTQTLLVLQAAETAGAVELVFDTTHAWTADRFAFGRPLGSYQAIKHRMADMVTMVHAIQAVVHDAARAVAHREPDAARLARIASLFTATRSLEVIQDCVQIHGGIGVTWEHDLHLYLRRAVTNRAHYGTPEELRASLAVLLAE